MPEPAVERDRPVILFLGDSLTVGYGVMPEQAYPALIQERLRAEGLEYHVVNAGVTGDTTASGLRRLDWLLRGRVDLLVLALGGNDGLRGIDVATTRTNLQGIIERARNNEPPIPVLLAGMQSPPNMGQDFTRAFREIFPELARDNDLPLVGFLLEKVGGEAELNQPDGIHPNPAGHRLIAENVWPVLRPLLVEAD